MYIYKQNLILLAASPVLIDFVNQLHICPWNQYFFLDERQPMSRTPDNVCANFYDNWLRSKQVKANKQTHSHISNIKLG